MWPYSWTHVGTPSHLGHMERVAATMPSQAHAGAAQKAPNIGEWERQDVPLVRPSSCTVKGGIPSSRRYLPTWTPDLEAREERRCSGRRALVGHGLDMEDLASMWGRQCRRACNLRSAAEELEETAINGRARRYWKRGSPKPAAETRAMETDPSPVRLWSAADSEVNSDGYRTAFPSESEEMAIPPTRAHTAPEPSLEHEAEVLERPTRARTAPVARHTEPQRDNMGNTPMAEDSEAPGTVGCAGSGGKHVECHCEHLSFLIGKYPKMGMDAIVQHLDRLENQRDGLEEDIAGVPG